MQVREITILGAGIIGISTGLYLQREGFQVTMIDQDEPGRGCSYGNGGLIQCPSVVPLATPGILRQVPRMLLDTKQPLVLRWQHLPSLLPFLLRFVASARADSIDHISRSLASIVPQAYDAYKPLIDAAGAQGLIQNNGELHLYQSSESFTKAQFAHGIRRAHGIEVQDLAGDAIYEHEPQLARVFKHGVYLPSTYSTTDPFRFTQALLRSFVAGGGRVKRAQIRDVVVQADGQVQVHTDAQTHVTAAVVVALGAFSRPIVERLGNFVPLNSERGYHLMLPGPQVPLRGCTIFADYKVALNPMGDAVRLLGMAELAKVGAPPDYQRIRRALPLAKQLVPGLRTEDATSWLGHRPSTPDSLPVISRSPHHRSVFFAFGHNHSGLTLGGITGQLVADLVCDRSPRVDVRPFDITRFKRWRLAPGPVAAATSNHTSAPVSHP